MSGIKGFGLTADEIIDYLLNKVGNNGTLFMPTYPDFPTINSKLKYEEHYEDILVYDPDNTKAWTGYLTEVFRHRNNTVRSKYPNNSLAAMSPYNEKIFEGELSSDLAFDKNSAWNYCMETHAKVLFLGIHAHHSISEIHIAEDRMDENWPVKGWYTEKKYKIIMGDKHIEKTCRVRKSFWNKYMVEYNGCYRLRKKGLLVERKIDNICVSYVPDVYKLEKFVEERAREKDLIYFKIPRRYMK
jgi:aminoglycoside 3-N-acetyltransferase